MAMPLSLMCMKCGNVFGSLVNHDKVIVPGRTESIQAVCTACANAAIKAKGIVPRTEEDWAQILAA